MQAELQKIATQHFLSEHFGGGSRKQLDAANYVCAVTRILLFLAAT
jgi:hypothetical protein